MDPLNTHEIPDHVTIITGEGGLTAFRVDTAWSEAEIYQHGAHVTRFRKKNEAPLLFTSAASEYQADKPIRGGVPLIFPWFGPREGMAAHGFARLAEWELSETRLMPDGSVRLHFRLPCEDEFEVVFIITVAKTLTMEFAVTNTGSSDFTFESCLHTYFQTGDIHRIEVAGLKGAGYLDSLTATRHEETAETIRFTAETDRIYQDTAATIEIHDPELRRIIRIHKSGSNSTVVWNPWIDKSKRMPDFGDDEYLHMVCVESGNVKENSITLKPGEQSVMEVVLESLPLG